MAYPVSMGGTLRLAICASENEGRGHLLLRAAAGVKCTSRHQRPSVEL
jgi:hypothetical protein